MVGANKGLIKENNLKKERIYFIIAGIASLVLLIDFLLFNPSSLFRGFLPVSFLYFSLNAFVHISSSIVSLLALFFVLKAFLIIAEKEGFPNLKRFIKIFFVLILVFSLVELSFPYWGGGVQGFATNIDVGESQNIVTTNHLGDTLEPVHSYLTLFLSLLEIFVIILYMVLGFWILKLRKKFGVLITLAGVMYISLGILGILLSLMDFVDSIIYGPYLLGPAIDSLIMLCFLLAIFIIKIIGHICLCILFFKLSKNKKINKE